MPLITWKTKYDLGIDIIDAEHKKLMQIINNLNDSMINKDARENILSVLDDLVSYTELHFKREEEYFDEFLYVNRNQHKRQHKALIKQIVDFRAKADQNTIGMPIEVMSFLKTWLTGHIMSEDKKYIPELKEKIIAKEKQINIETKNAA